MTVSVEDNRAPRLLGPRRSVAFGPIMPGFGSWEWIGQAMAESLADDFEVTTFRDEVPETDAVVFVKFRPPGGMLREIARRSAILFCPVDGYASASEIDADADALLACDRIVLHAGRLAKYFRPYAPTLSIDHHANFAAPLRREFVSEGPILWAGVHSNLGPVVEWVNRHDLPDELWLLTNSGERTPTSDELGFRGDRSVRVERWSAQRQRDWTALARAAFDVKGSDFRARHKPPVKAFDFLASGVSFATNLDSSPSEHLHELGFPVASITDPDRWLSREYFDETVGFGQVLRERISREQVAARWREILSDVLDSRPAAAPPSITSPPRADAVVAPFAAPSEPTTTAPASRPTRVAILSLLFNWPSTGGGTIHTYETAQFLSQAGYDVRHFYAQYAGWGVGRVTEPLGAPSEPIRFHESTWTPDDIRSRFREAVDAFAPDFVILTDSWNTKPLLAEAVAGYRYFLRLAALECLCPLNNVRLLVDRSGRPAACGNHQLATPDLCRMCVRRNERSSGALHQADRDLGGFAEDDYPDRLKRAFAEAEGVLAVNPAIADLVRPFARAVHVLPSGFDASRFDIERLDANPVPRTPGKLRIFFAGLTQEYMKGFAVLQAACARLWRVRQDFELVATGEPWGEPNEFTRSVGWLSQSDLPRHLRSADLLVFPTIAEEALGRSAVEAMGCGRPVLASRIGGLSHTVRDGETGLLFEPGNDRDLLAKLTQLLDQPALRQQLGEAGRRRFESEYSWEVILARYEGLLGPPVRSGATLPEADLSQGASLGPEPASELGCVLAVQNRPVDVLERTLASYAFQSLSPVDKVLVDFGSEPGLADAYRQLGATHGWRVVAIGPVGRPWSLSTAYNAAVGQLHPEVDVVFKNDADVLLGPGVLEKAAQSGRNRLCLFSCLTTGEGAELPNAITSADQVVALLDRDPPPMPMDGEGVHAFPRRWFEEIGGFDAAYAGWGFEDSDLRLRATWSIGVVRERSPLLIHQWHPRPADAEQTGRNRRYYQSTKKKRQVVRNGGQLLAQGNSARSIPSEWNGDAAPGKRLAKVVLATRSLQEPLYRMSGAFLDFGNTEPARLRPVERYRFVDTDAAGYLRELTRLDADWIVNLDEDAFLIDPQALVSLIERMEREGYAACGMPDGGVVPIRRHNPLALNTFFNVFHGPRIRWAWRDWNRVLETALPAAACRHLPEFARRTELALDRFEPYYPAFFALLEAGERILSLDAETWEDGISTVLKSPDDKPLLIHAWYARAWNEDEATRLRYARVQEFARAARCHRNTVTTDEPLLIGA